MTDNPKSWTSAELKAHCATQLIALLAECVHLGDEPEDQGIIEAVTRANALTSCGLVSVAKARAAHKALNTAVVLIGSRRSHGDPENDEQLIYNAQMLLQTVGALQHALVREEADARAEELRRKGKAARLLVYQIALITENHNNGDGTGRPA